MGQTNKLGFNTILEKFYIMFAPWMRVVETHKHNQQFAELFQVRTWHVEQVQGWEQEEVFLNVCE